MPAHKLPNNQAALNKAACSKRWREENRQRVRDLEKARREASPEQFKAAKRRHYVKNHEKVLDYARDYREKNADQIKERRTGKNAIWSGRYREKNYERCLAMSAAWKKANPERHTVHQQNRRARAKEVGGVISPDLPARLLIAQKWRCACCGRSLAKGFQLDHIIPLALGGSNSDDNIQLLTPECNRQKGAKNPVEFMQSRGKLL